MGNKIIRKKENGTLNTRAISLYFQNGLRYLNKSTILLIPKYSVLSSGKSGGFTLVEVLISALILSVVAFGILRLSSNNANQSGIIERNRLMDETVFNTRECLKSMDYNSLNSLTSTVSINFGIDNNSCLTGSYNEDLSFSGIIYKTYVEGIESRPDEIYSYIKIGTGASVLNIENYVSDGSNTKKSVYKIYK